jgi:hypothetical protein
VRKKNLIWDFIYCLLLPKASGAGELVEVVWKYIIFNDFKYERGTKYYGKYNEAIRQIMKDNGRPLLKSNAKQGWKLLCDLVGKKVPSTPYRREKKNRIGIFHARFPILIRNPVLLWK